MDKCIIHKPVTQFQIIQLCMEFKEDMVALKTFAEMSRRKPSERMAEEWLSGLQVMKILKISRGTLQSYREKGTLPFTYINKKIYYRASDVEVLLKSNYKKPPLKGNSNHGTGHY